MHSTLFFAEIPNPGPDWPKSVDFLVFLTFFTIFFTSFKNKKWKLEFVFTIFAVFAIFHLSFTLTKWLDCTWVLNKSRNN